MVAPASGNKVPKEEGGVTSEVALQKTKPNAAKEASNPVVENPIPEDPAAGSNGASVAAPKKEEATFCAYPRIGGEASQSTHGFQASSAAEAIRLKNPKYQMRPDRLDLISHGIQSLSAKLGSHAYALCDISPWGFSYAQEIKIPRGVLFKKMKQRLNTKLSQVVGSHLPFTIFLSEKSEQSTMTVNGWVRNFRLFFALPLPDVSKEIKRYLYRRSYSEIHDPYGLFAKGCLIMSHAEQLQEAGKWDTHCLVSLNISMMQFLEELGATEQFFYDLWMRYDRSPLFAKFGVYVEEGEQAQDLLGLAGLNEELGEPRPLPKLPPSLDQVAASKLMLHKIQTAKVKKPVTPQSAKAQVLYQEANKKYHAAPLLATAWKGLMHLYHLDETIHFPRVIDSKLKQQIEVEMHLPLEHIFDTSNNSPQLTINRIMAFELSHLIEKTSKMKPPPLSSLMLKVLQVKAKVFSIAIKKLA